jgi:hypothetical protein
VDGRKSGRVIVLPQIVERPVRGWAPRPGVISPFVKSIAFPKWGTHNIGISRLKMKGIFMPLFHFSSHAILYTKSIKIWYIIIVNLRIMDKLASVLADAQVDLNPHQVEAIFSILL